jgi:hypothetical protein
MADRGYSTLTKLGLGALTFNSALAIYNSWGDAGSVGFVLAADAALVLLFLCLRAFEQGARGGRDAKVKAAVWALTTLLTAMFASRVAPLMPPAVGVLVFICLRDVDHVRGGEGGHGINTDGQYYALAKVGFAVLTCNSAVEAYDTRRDPGSAAFMLVSYANLVILIGLFLRAFARGHAGEHGQGQGQGAGCPY